jgi:hypothetical protein
MICANCRLYAGNPSMYSDGMKQSLNLQLEEELLQKAEVRAAQAGLDCTEYVRGLIEHDVQHAAATPHRFASEDLVGAFELNGEPATNQRVRENLRRRSNAHDAGDR